MVCPNISNINFLFIVTPLELQAEEGPRIHVSYGVLYQYRGRTVGWFDYLQNQKKLHPHTKDDVCIFGPVKLDVFMSWKYIVENFFEVITMGSSEDWCLNWRPVVI